VRKLTARNQVAMRGCLHLLRRLCEQNSSSGRANGRSGTSGGATKHVLVVKDTKLDRDTILMWISNDSLAIVTRRGLGVSARDSETPKSERSRSRYRS
jgi:hypothetical protein